MGTLLLTIFHDVEDKLMEQLDLQQSMYCQERTVRTACRFLFCSFIWLMTPRKKLPPPDVGVGDKLTLTVLCKKNEKGDMDNNR